MFKHFISQYKLYLNMRPSTQVLPSFGKTHQLQNFEISFFRIFSIVTQMSFLRANFEFVLLHNFELSMVAKPINSISVQNVVKKFKK